MISKILAGKRRHIATLAAATGTLTLAASFAVTGTEPAAAAGPAPADITTVCSADAVQSVAAALGAGVTVKPIGNGPNFPGGVRYVAANAEVPAFCQVTGSFVTNPATGKTANFMATLPANWNGKFLQLGCSGHCGQFAVSDPANPMTITVTNQGRPWDGIKKGYAQFATDEGHEGFAGGTWADKGPGKVDQEAIDDLLYRADKVLARVGKQFTTGFYDRVRGTRQTIARSYFNGCSGGGRDAFVAASRFPEEFDGIIGGSAYDPQGAAFQFAGVSIAQLRSPGAVVPANLLNLIAPMVTAQCDGLDGVKDGLIQNPAACNFVAERDLPKCDGSNAGQCFTPEQAQTVSTLLTAVTDETGRVVQPGLSVSDLQAMSFTTPKRPADLTARDPFPGSDNGDFGSNGYWPLANAYLKLFVHKNDPGFFLRDIISFQSGGKGPVTAYRIVVPSAEVALLKQRTAMGIGHTPQNWNRLIQQDRKFLMWHNFSDNVLSPYMAVNFYKKLARMHGGYAKLQRNVRLFALPGTGHCSMSGEGPNTFDALTAMENWVEKGIAPDALPAVQYPVNAFGLKDFTKPQGRGMPLCKFPEMASYKGTGDVRAAVNWECRPDDKRMLQIGESGREAGVLQ
jgi:feruloyl esterase